MNTKKILEIVEESDKLSQIEKVITKNFLSRVELEENQNNKEKELVKTIGLDKNVSEIILSTNEVIIYTVKGIAEWEVKYPYRSIYFKDGKWKRNGTVSPSFDVAYLSYLEKKHLGENNQFTDFALKMLEIKIEE